MNVGAVAMLADVRMALTDDSAQIVDARSAERFAGKAPEPRPGLRSGHMPGSFNVPFERVLDNGRLASRERIEEAFTSAGVDLDKPIITSCGSGVTAAILTFALDRIGKPPRAYTTARGRNGARGPTFRSSAASMRAGNAKPVALVTGGANGIGRAIAHHLLAAGWRLGVVDLPGSGLRRAFPPRERNVVLIEGDVREEETASRAVDTLRRALRPARCHRLQRRHHDPQAAAPADARRMASRHRHQSDRDVPVWRAPPKSRCAKRAARSSPSPRPVR